MQSGLGAISLKKKLALCKKKIGTVKKSKENQNTTRMAHPQSVSFFLSLSPLTDSLIKRIHLDPCEPLALELR